MRSIVDRLALVWWTRTARLRDLAGRWRRLPRIWVQRARYGVSRDDAYSLDGWLAQVIVQGIKVLREEEHSYPMGMTPEDWADTLERMQMGFQVYVATDDWNRPEVQHAMQLFCLFFADLWD